METAGLILAVLPACAKVGKTLFDLVNDYKEAPEDIRGLAAEVATFRAILQRVHDAADASDHVADATIHNAVFECKTTVRKIEKLVQKATKEPETADPLNITYRKLTWTTRLSAKAADIRTRLRQNQLSLCTAIGVESLLTTIATYEVSREVLKEVSHVSCTIDIYSEKMTTKIDEHHDKVLLRVGTLGEQLANVHKAITTLTTTSLPPSPTPSLPTPTTPTQTSPTSTSSTPSSPPPAYSGIDGFDFQAPPSSCSVVLPLKLPRDLPPSDEDLISPVIRSDSWVTRLQASADCSAIECKCCCHTRVFRQQLTPNSLGVYFGTWIVRYTGATQKKRCNMPDTCRRSLRTVEGPVTKFTYEVPPWFRNAVTGLDIDKAVMNFFGCQLRLSVRPPSRVTEIPEVTFWTGRKNVRYTLHLSDKELEKIWLLLRESKVTSRDLIYIRYPKEPDEKKVPYTHSLLSFDKHNDTFQGTLLHIAASMLDFEAIKMIFQVSTNFSKDTKLKYSDLDPWAKDEFGWTALDIVIAYPYRTQTYGTRWMVPGIQGTRGNDPLSAEKMAAREKIIHWFFRWTDYCVYDTPLPLHNLIMVPPDLRRDRLRDLVAHYYDHLDYAPEDDPTKPECYAKLTPLHLAVSEGRHDDVRILLEAGADYMLLSDQNTQSFPLAIALQKVVRALLPQPKALELGSENSHKAQQEPPVDYENLHINPRKVFCAIAMVRGVMKDESIQKSTRLVDLCCEILGKINLWLGEPGNDTSPYAPYVQELKRLLIACGLDAVPPKGVLDWMIAKYEAGEWPEFKGWDGQTYKPMPRCFTRAGPVPRPVVTAS